MKDENIEKTQEVLRTCRLTGTERDFLERLVDEALVDPNFQFEVRERDRLREIFQNHGIF